MKQALDFGHLRVVEPLSEKTGQASRMGVGRFPSFFSCFLVSVSDVERQYFYIQTPYSFRDPTTPPKIGRYGREIR